MQELTPEKTYQVFARNPVFHSEEHVSDNFFRVTVDAEGPEYLLRLYPFGIFALEGEEVSEHFLERLEGTVEATEPFSYFQPLLILTNNCNLACTYCYAHEGSYGTPTNTMTEEVVNRTIDFLHQTIHHRFASKTESGKKYELGAICFGGEPLLALHLVEQTYKRLSEISDTLTEHWPGIFSPLITLNTNAFSVSTSAMAVLERIKSNLELVVSFDGWLHDECRLTKGGAESSARVLENLYRLHKAGINVSVTSCILPDAVDEPERTLDSLSDIYGRGIPVNMSFIRGPLAPVQGRAMYPGVLQRMYSEDTLDRFGMLVANEIRGGAPIFTRRYRRRLFEGGYNVRCAAGLYEFAVMPDGKVYPCHNFIAPGHALGNIANVDFDINGNTPLLKSLSSRSVKELQPCSECVLQSTCMSSFDCPAHSLQDLGALDMVDYRFCGFARRVQGAILAEFIKERENV